MAKSKKQVEPRKGGRGTASKMLPGQPVHDAPSKGTLPTAEDRQEEYSKLDHTTLAQNMQAVCVGLALAINESGKRFDAPPALNYSDVEDRIPLALYTIAVNAKWIKEQIELTDDEYENNKDAELFGNRLYLTASFNEWFLGLVEKQLAILENLAEANLPKQEEFDKETRDRRMADFSASFADSKKNKTLKHLFDTSKRLHGVTKLARVADAAGKKMNPPIRVTHSSVSRINNGEGNVGPDILEVVASVINQELPCTRADLEPTTPRQTKRPHSNRQK